MIPVSPTSLGTFLTCPRQFEAKYITKEVVFQPTVATIYGDRMHKAIEAYAVSGAPLGPEFEHVKPYVDQVLATPGKVLVEQKLAYNEHFMTVPWRERWAGAIGDLMVIGKKEALIVDWKGLPLDAEIPTAQGFVRMGDLQVGDQVFDSKGKPCKVLGKSTAKEVPCVRLHYDDKTSVVCDLEHRWLISNGHVVTAQDLAVGDSMPVCLAVEHVEATLPLDPYVLGLWLADGKHTDSSISKPDAFVWDEIERRGYKAAPPCRSCGITRTVLGIRGALRSLNLLGNKHIPLQYMQASIQQRTDLVRGLMDGDGNANPTRKQAVFTTVEKEFSDQVKELLASLGFRVNQATTTQRGFGLTVTAYPLAFRPFRFNPFLLPRKAERIATTWGAGKSGTRTVTKIEPIGNMTTQCIEVDSPDNTYLCGREYHVTHNSGKVKQDLMQLEMLIHGVFGTYGNVQKVRAALVFFQSGDIVSMTAERGTFKTEKLLSDIARYTVAQQSANYPPRPNGLCRSWCDVVACPHNGKTTAR